MKLTLVPAENKFRASFEVHGDVLFVGGEELDFSPMADGDVLPSEAIDCPWVVGDVTKASGVVDLTLISGYLGVAPTGVVIDDADGVISQPGDAGESAVVQAAINWTLLRSAADVTADVQAGRDSAVRAEMTRRLRAQVPNYSAEEIATWPEQIAEATAYLADSSADVPMLAALASARGIPVGDMINRVMSNRDAYKALSTDLLAKQSALLSMSPIPADFASDSYWT